jgi:hypothetical protein
MRMDPTAARHALTDHPYYRYRGCAPDPDDPRVSAGDPSLHVDAWQAPDVDGGEDQQVRRDREAAAKAVCGRCPVMEACAAYGASVTAEGKLAERHAILGGATAVERTRALVEERQAAPVVAEPAPDHELRTPQKLAVLRAWAAYETPEDVARAAGMDVRTANWQRSILKTKLGLEKAATRAEVLEAAVARRLLRADAVVPSPGAGKRPALSSSPARPAVPESGACRRPGRRVHRRRVAIVAGQLSFDDALAPTPTAPVTALFSSKPVLEAAA